MRALVMFGTNVFLTALTATGVGPAAFKMEHRFGLVGWAGRTPFYLLPLYIAPAVMVLATAKPVSPMKGALVGFGFTLPLVLWSISTHCVPKVQAVYVVSGVLQGALLAWLGSYKRA
jgi:hypothetical protein